IDLIIHDDETEPNIDYIINFLESFHSEKGHNKINDLKKFDTYIYVESTSTLEMKSLIDALTEESTNIEAVSEVRTTFEHGAGSFICGFLIGIISNAAWYAIEKKINSFSKREDSQITVLHKGTLKVDSLKKNVSEYTDVNLHDLDL